MQPIVNTHCPGSYVPAAAGRLLIKSMAGLDSTQSQHLRLTGRKMPLSPFKMLMDLLLPRLSLSIDKTSCRWHNTAWHGDETTLLPGSNAVQTFQGISSLASSLRHRLEHVKDGCPTDSAHRQLCKAPDPELGRERRTFAHLASIENAVGQSGKGPGSHIHCGPH